MNAPLGGACAVLATNLSDGKSRWPARLPTMQRRAGAPVASE
ncbi:MAG: hypothetical protein P9E88_04665 [Candidatus Competibacter sp.]|nr:hypothetical protein [Candidatus Competibacter sp.]